MWCSASWETLGGHLTSTTNLCSWSNLGNTSSTSFENRWMNWMMDATCCVFLHFHPFCFRMSFLWPKYPKFGWGMSRWHRGGSNKRPQVQDKTTTLRIIWACSSLVVSLGGWPAISQDLSDSCDSNWPSHPKSIKKFTLQPCCRANAPTQLWQEGVSDTCCQLIKQKGWWVGVLKLIYMAILLKQYLAAPGDETPKFSLVHHMLLSCDCQKKSSTEFLRNRFWNPGTPSKNYTDFDSMCHTNHHMCRIYVYNIVYVTLYQPKSLQVVPPFT